MYVHAWDHLRVLQGRGFMAVAETSSLAKRVASVVSKKKEDDPTHADAPAPRSAPTANAADGPDTKPAEPAAPRGGTSGAASGQKMNSERPHEPVVETSFEAENPVEATGADSGENGDGARLGAEMINADSIRDQARDQRDEREAAFERAAGMDIDEVASSDESGSGWNDIKDSLTRADVGDVSEDDLDAAVDDRIERYEEKRELNGEQEERLRAHYERSMQTQYEALVEAQSVYDDARTEVRSIKDQIDVLNEGADEVAQESFEAADEFAREYDIELTGGDEGLELVVSDEEGSSFFRSSENMIQISIDQESQVHKGLANDNVYHEYGHAVVHSQTDLDTSRTETGAVSESLADTYAAMIDRDDWFITENAVPGGIRDMTGEASGDPVSTEELEDGVGIHTAAGVPNRAAYLIGEELGRDQMADIYMETIQNHLDEDMTIADLANGTIASAEHLYGTNSAEAKAVESAWNEVGYSDDQIESGDSVIDNSVPTPSSGESDEHGHEH